MKKYYCDMCKNEIPYGVEVCHLSISKVISPVTPRPVEKEICEKCYNKIIEMTKWKKED
jgi:hypothetical protein